MRTVEVRVPARWCRRWFVAVAFTIALLAVQFAADPDAAAARPLPPPCDVQTETAFTDVSRYRTHGSAIACLSRLAIAEGITATRYGYDEGLRHGQLASLVVRSLDATEDLRYPLAYPFEPWYEVDTVHQLAINRLYESAIISDLDVYDHTAPVTRGEMAALVANALVFAGVLDHEADTRVFEDVDEYPHADAIHRLGEVGVVHGDGQGQFRPDRALNRAQMATFVANLLAVIANGGEPLPLPAPPPPEPEPEPEPPPVGRTPEGWLVAGGNGEVVGSSGGLVRYTVEVADGLESRTAVPDLADRIEGILSDPDRGWTARGRHRLQRVENPARAQVRVLLASPARVDRLCGQVGLRTAGIYSCWTGRFATLNSDRWFSGVAHIDDLELYRDYLVNHEVGHGLGYGHVACPGAGRLAPVMVQQTMPHRLSSCRPNGWPYP